MRLAGNGIRGGLTVQTGKKEEVSEKLLEEKSSVSGGNSDQGRNERRFPGEGENMVTRVWVFRGGEGAGA